MVRIVDTGWTDQERVHFASVRRAGADGASHQAGQRVVEVHAPAHPQGLVDITLQNQDAGNVPIPAEHVTISAAFRYRRARLAVESDLTRLIRELLHLLKQQLLEQTAISVAVDYREMTSGDVALLTITQLP